MFNTWANSGMTKDADEGGEVKACSISRLVFRFSEVIRQIFVDDKIPLICFKNGGVACYQVLGQGRVLALKYNLR